MVKVILSRKKTAGNITVPIQVMIHSHCNKKNTLVPIKPTYIHQFNRLEDLKINPHSFIYLIITKVPKTHSLEKITSSTNSAGKSIPKKNRKIRKSQSSDICC